MRRIEEEEEEEDDILSSSQSYKHTSNTVAALACLYLRFHTY